VAPTPREKQARIGLALRLTLVVGVLVAIALERQWF
jgi:hypothetical protein